MKLTWIKRSESFVIATIQLSESVRIEATIDTYNNEEWYPGIQVLKVGSGEDALMFDVDGDPCDSLDEAKLAAQDFVDFLDQHMDEEVGSLQAKKDAIAEAKTLFLGLKNGNPVD